MSFIMKVDRYKRGEVGIFEDIFKEIEKNILYIKYKFNDDEIYDVIICYIPELLEKVELNKFNTSIHLKNYLKKSFENKALDIIKKRCREGNIISYNSEILETQENKLINSEYIGGELEFDDLISNLNKKEKYILKRFFKEMDTISEIAKTMNVSRQFVNKIKNNALNKLRESNIAS